MHIVMNILIFNLWVTFGYGVIYAFNDSDIEPIHDSFITVLFTAVIWPVYLIHKIIQVFKIRCNLIKLKFLLRRLHK